MSRLNALDRSALQQGLSQLHRELVRQTTEWTGANSEPVRKAANALGRAWRQQLSTPAGALRTSLKTRRVRGTPSEPGQPPHAVTRKLQKSITTGVVDGVRRVGSWLFKARLLEFGVSAVVTRRRSPKGQRKGRQKVALRGAAYQFRIEPRPSAAKALEQATPEMADVFLSELQKRVARG